MVVYLRLYFQGCMDWRSAAMWRIFPVISFHHFDIDFHLEKTEPDDDKSGPHAAAPTSFCSLDSQPRPFEMHMDATPAKLSYAAPEYGIAASLMHTVLHPTMNKATSSRQSHRSGLMCRFNGYICASISQEVSPAFLLLVVFLSVLSLQ